MARTEADVVSARPPEALAAWCLLKGRGALASTDPPVHRSTPAHPADSRTFLALDLGGTNLRVCEVKLEGNHKFSQKQQKYRVSEDLKEGEARTLFSESHPPGKRAERSGRPCPRRSPFQLPWVSSS